jgi:UDP-N-acetylmuramate--alanine ligase
MKDFNKIKGFYFVGIGGNGMSAVALYFIKNGFFVAGYDRSESKITDSLVANGCRINFDDNVNSIPELFRNLNEKDNVIVVYTPAISSENKILSFFRENGYSILKRSEILGEISASTETLAIAGSHGKTTVSNMTAHILKQSKIDCSAFLGGVSKNYESNFLLGTSAFTVIEADEFDRSFHRLTPTMAAVTSLDADHLDIYGDRKTMVEAYNIFCGKIKKGGKLVVNEKIRNEIIVPDGVTCYTYGTERKSDFYAFNIVHCSDGYRFNLKTPTTIFEDIFFPFPGIINIENFTVASAIALLCGVDEHEIKKAAMSFQGVRRRFDIRIDLEGITYIDDYAHHPEEIRAFIKSIREYYAGRKITGIFQPHLFTRTRDHATGFAAMLDELDETILLPIYPAREEPIEGVSSEMIFRQMRSANKLLLKKEEVVNALDMNNIDVLLTIGAGDIDRLVDPIEEKIKRMAKR